MMSLMAAILTAMATPSLSFNVSPALYIPTNGTAALSVMSTFGMNMPINDRLRLSGEVGFAVTQKGSVVPRVGAGLVWGISKEVGVATMLTYGTDWTLTSQSVGLVICPSVKVTESVRLGVGVGPIITFSGQSQALGFTVAPRVIVSF